MRYKFELLNLQKDHVCTSSRYVSKIGWAKYNLEDLEDFFTKISGHPGVRPKIFRTNFFILGLRTKCRPKTKYNVTIKAYLIMYNFLLTYIHYTNRIFIYKLWANLIHKIDSRMGSTKRSR
jgi:hypothetical protein